MTIALDRADIEKIQLFVRTLYKLDLYDLINPLTFQNVVPRR